MHILQQIKFIFINLTHLSFEQWGFKWEIKSNNIESKEFWEKKELNETELKIDDLEKKLIELKLTEKFTKWIKESLYKWLTWDPSIKNDPEAKATIDMFKRYESLNQAAIDESKLTKEELESITKIWNKYEFNASSNENVENNKYSNEQLKTISNNEFLSLPKEERLQYVTKNNIDSENISNGSVNDVEFTFTFDWEYNKELYLLTTAGQVLPKEVWEVRVLDKIYSRNNLDGEFFNWSERLIINEWTKIDIDKIRTPNELNDLKNKVNEWLEKYKDLKNQDLILESLNRWIDPEFSEMVIWEKIKDKPIGSVERMVLIEEIFTEFDRIRPSITMWDWKILEWNKYPDDFVLKLLSKFNTNYEKLAMDYWIDIVNIEGFKNRKNTPDYLSISSQNEIIARAPENVKNLVRLYFPPEEYENALLVCNWESGYKENAINNNTDKHRSTDRWLFQINDYWHGDKYVWKDIFDPEVNVKIASEIFKESWNSWTPWYAARKIWLA